MKVSAYLGFRPTFGAFAPVGQSIRRVRGSALLASLAFLLIPGNPATAGALESIADAYGCDYDSLGPGGYFQGVGDIYGNPCQVQGALDGPAQASFSFTIHPGLSGENGAPTTGSGFSVPGANKSFVDAFAENGGGGEADADLIFEVVNKNTGMADPSATVLVQLAGFAEISTSDKFRFWNNSGWDFAVYPYLPPDSADYASASGNWNANDGSQSSGYCDGQDCSASLSTPNVQQVLEFQLNGTNALFEVTESAYANLTAVAGIDPIFTVANPNDVILGPPFDSDPDAPLFTEAQLSEFESFGISTAGIPNTVPIVTPEPSSMAPVAIVLAVLLPAGWKKVRKKSSSGPGAASCV